MPSKTIFVDRLFLTSLAIVWMFLALVRFVPTEIPYMNALPHQVPALIVFALSFGLRFCRQAGPFAWYSGLSAVLLLAIATYCDLGIYPLVHRDATSLWIGIGALVLVTLSILLFFFKAGQILGFELQASQQENIILPLVLGAAAAVLPFAILTNFNFAFWYLVPIPLFLPMRRRWQSFLAVLLLIVFCFVIGGRFVFSPYRKIEARSVTNGFLVFGNGIFYQSCVGMPKAEDLPQLANMPRTSPNVGVLKHYLGRLLMPIVVSSHLDDVLILGAGCGNDVAFAINNGASKIEAVEIDPVLVKLGRTSHPDKPYSLTNVLVHTGDPRSFLTHSRKKYDLIEFCYINSGRTAATSYELGQESFVYTVECLNSAIDCLKPDGIVFVGFTGPKATISAKRLYATMVASKAKDKFACRQHDVAVIDLQPEFSFFMMGPGVKKLNSQAMAPVAEFIHLSRFEEEAEDAKTCTDNWPYLYLSPQHLTLETTVSFAAIVFLIAISSFFGKDKLTLSSKLSALSSGLLCTLSSQIASAFASIFFGAVWFVPPVLFLFQLTCFALASKVGSAVRAKFQLLNFLLSAAISLIIITQGSQIGLSLSAALCLIFLNAMLVVSELESHIANSKSSGLAIFAAGIALGYATDMFSVHLGLRSLAFIVAITLLLSYFSRKR